MKYTPKEKYILDSIQKTDFKNLSKNDMISFSSKIEELRPEVAKEILAKFPEFVSLIKSALTEYKRMIDKIIDSDDSSIKEYYGIANKEMDNTSESRKQFYDFIKQVQADYSKVLNNSNLSPKIMLEILNREAEFVKIANEKDTEIRHLEKEIENNVNKKDAEKREFNWKLVGGISLFLIAVGGISAGILGGKFNFNLSKKS
ncbi:hypothetical protein LC668_09600 (plasmid) [Fusobacterium vincentii]|jgi:hypothetical protein|uniref:hypothetical protein n=1 Tax=Fusobacterium TaxID=848 RepID=UPI001EEDA896|nr:hypothetical protein [Fusobacterium nucleatum]MCG6836812.1 hypothetical protein [Fusobacterium nucleatum]